MSTIRDQSATVAELRWWRNIALYGPPKVGKSTFCAQAQLHSESADVLFLDCDPGGGSISFLNHKSLRDSVQVIPCRDGGAKKIMEIGWKLKRNPEGFKTVVIDTKSELLQLELLRLRVKNKGKPGREEFKSTQPDYGEVNNMLKEIIYFYVDLPMNVVFVCHQRENILIEDGVDVRLTRPALSPEVSGTLAGSVDLTCYLDNDVALNGDITRKLRVRPARRTQAGTRLFFPTAELKDPTFKDLLTHYIPPDMVESPSKEGTNAD